VVSRGRVLVVDDDPMVRRLMDRILAGAGFCDVRDAASAQEALDAVTSDPPDQLIMDLHMPGGGLRLLARLAAASRPAILVVTGDTDPAVRDAALAAGASDFLLKPFDGDDLVERVRALLPGE
jgi:two-component system, OmpR family, KDP operon response regulator KdpE